MIKEGGADITWIETEESGEEIKSFIRELDTTTKGCAWKCFSEFTPLRTVRKR
jgi:methionine synthase I (cobalamin-dependent)